MNGKKAKMLRKSGNVDKKVKKMYNSLNPRERYILSQAYSDMVRTVVVEETANELPEADQTDV